MITSCKTLLTLLLLLAGAGTVLAGNLDPPAAPTDPASALYTTNDLYNRLTTGAAGAKRTGPFTEPTASPAPTGHTTDELQSLNDLGTFGPALPAGNPFINVQSTAYDFSWYWSSTNYVNDPLYAWAIDLWAGYVNAYTKSFYAYVWPVRAGQ